jgi:predicted amidohydrolase
MSNSDNDYERTKNAGIEMLKESARQGVDIICLPEYFNCIGCAIDKISDNTGSAVYTLLDQIATLARKYECYILVPVIINIEQKRFNRTVIFDRKGIQIGYYDKVHITRVEREDLNIEAGNIWPVFQLDFGNIGIMTCYDGCFIESARILALKEAEIVFWPSLQRSYTEDELILQTRANAYFNHIVLVRSSYGTEKKHVWTPNKMIGMSCICDTDGTIIANLGRWSGYVSSKVDLDLPLRAVRSFGGEEGVLRQMRFEDRRPNTYKKINEDKMS